MIEQLVAKEFGLTVHEMLEKSRKYHILEARQIAMFFYREMTDLSLYQIGGILGNKDHSTVIYSCRKVNDQYEVDKRYRAKIDKLRMLIKNVKL